MFEFRSRAGRRSALRWPVAVLGALIAAMIAAPGAAAEPPANPNMFDTNVPYVAWRGEQVRAVKCDSIPQMYDGDGVLRAEGLQADILVESWSGPGRDPQLESGTVRFFRSSEDLPRLRRDCVRFDMVSSDAGLARVKLVVSDRNGEPIMKHQFLFVWMTLGDLSIKEATSNDPPVPDGSAAAVADPTGDGQFNAGDQPWNKGRVKLTLTGTFPHPLGPGGTYTLPQDWPALAAAFATDNNPYNNDLLLWDIHDDQGMGALHVSGGCGYWPGPVDDVDNCNGGGDTGTFSNVFGQTLAGSGPFDPARPGTLLSNGRLTAEDAPMPAARIDVKIAANSGDDEDLSGVGSLRKADKTDLYSRDGNGTPSRHNLYAPYYRQWIPATAQGSPEASGIDGPQRGNNFEGFFLDGLYDNWDTFPLAWAHDGPTDCNLTVSWRRTLGINGGYDVPRRMPYGPQTVAVYTDEHGEAQVEYRPGTGFYFDNLATVMNDNRGCDLQDIDVLGTSDINAVARYPYQPVDDPPRTSSTIQKTVHSLFDKSLSYYPKGEVTGSNTANGNARIVVAHANDIDGSPFSNELVCWMLDSNSEGSLPFSGWTGPAEGRFYVHSTPVPIGNIAFDVDGCARTDSNGNVAIEVFNSNGTKVNVISLFADEGLLRDIKVDFGTAGSGGGNPPQGGGNPPQGGGEPDKVAQGTNPPTVQQIAAAGGPEAAAVLATPAGPKAKAGKAGKARIKVVRSKLKSGKNRLWIHVSSTRKRERIVIRIGKRKLTRSVSTNRLVRVPGLALKKGARVSVRLAP